MVEKESTSGLSLNVLILVGSMIVALVASVASLVVYTRSKKKGIENLQLKSTVDYLRSKINILVNEPSVQKKNIL